MCKIDPAGDHKFSNTVVICNLCQEEIAKGNIKLHECYFYFKELCKQLGSKELAEKIRNKLYYTRQKYKVKEDEEDKEL